MVEELSKDYANFIAKTNLSREVQPIISNIDDLITRLDEMESLVNLVKNEAQVTQDYLPQISALRDEFKDICHRVDSFESVIRIINKNLTELEKQVEVAGDELGYKETGLTGLLKPLFKDHRRPGDPVPSNLDASGEFVPVKVFSASDYFPDSSSC